MFKDLIDQIKPLDQPAAARAKARWSSIAKPLNSLGLLEEAIIQIAGITGDAEIEIGKKAVVIMCADNGVVDEGISQTGADVTSIVTSNFTFGNASVCIMAAAAGADVIPVDIGVAGTLSDTGSRYPLIRKKVCFGSRNMSREPAMTRAETQQAIETGILLVKELKERGYRLLATGEMGIGNTTTSSAVASVLAGAAVPEMTGAGAGLSKAGVQHKIQVIEQAIAKHRPNPKDPVDVLAKVGGLDLAGLTGIFLGGARYRVPIIIDGFISAAAALSASRLCPAAVDYMLASHLSKEPAAGRILTLLGKKPLLVCQMSLGEGTGAVAALPLIDMAAAVYRQMSTFEEIKVEEYQPFSEEEDG